MIGGSAALAAIVMLGLTFDPRYRYFRIAPFLVPAVVAFLYAPGDGPWRERNRVLGWLLAACLSVGLWQETLLNLQAVAWCGVMALLAAGLLRGRSQADARSADGRLRLSASASSATTAAGAPKRTL